MIFKYTQGHAQHAQVLSNDHLERSKMQDHVRGGVVKRDWLDEHAIKYIFMGDTFLPSNLPGDPTDGPAAADARSAVARATARDPQTRGRWWAKHRISNPRDWI